MAIPSIFIKRLREKFERLQMVQRADPRRSDHQRVATLLRPVSIGVEVRVDGGSMSADDLAALEVGELLMFNVPSDRPLKAYVNDHPLFLGTLGTVGERLVFTVEQPHGVE